VFMAGFAVFTAASLVCALAPNATLLIASRGVQGLGAAILVPNSLALLSHTIMPMKSAAGARSASGQRAPVWR
jgi:MFS transporter, DHA2 family, methylenomycin A resistance protein